MTHETPDDTPAPNLRKTPPEPPTPSASIWEPLDGSVPKLPAVDPRVGAWGQPHQPGAVPPQAAAAAYAAHQQPGGAAGVFTLASWGRRLVSFLIDSLLFGMVSVAITLTFGLAYGMTVNESVMFFSMLQPAPDSVTDTTPLYVVLIAARILVGAIPAFFLARWNGQTPGKRIMGLRVMRADGEPMTLKVAIRRELLGRTLVVDTLTAITFGLAGLANYLWPLWDQQRRAGHDAIADTRVITAPKS